MTHQIVGFVQIWQMHYQNFFLQEYNLPRRLQIENYQEHYSYKKVTDAVFYSEIFSQYQFG